MIWYGNKTYKDCIKNLQAPNSINVKYKEASLYQWIVGILTIVNAINTLESVGAMDISISLGTDLSLKGDISGIIATAIFLTLTVTTAGMWTSANLSRPVYYWRFWQNDADGKAYVWVSNSTVMADGVTKFLNIDKADFSGRLYEVKETYSTYKKDSSALLLKGVISKWYSTFRTFALVALLSVLLYIGIRIIMSSNSAQDSAKYKKMLVSWFTAICILFLLHYLMVIILEVTELLIDLFNINSLSDGGVDYFITSIRNSIVQENGSYFRHWGYVIMYVSLVIMTITFTFQYIKRLIFVSLLTMIAPLIALTYPLDKIRDGRAQAFSIWLKEYAFNCLIQPVHLLLYSMLVSSAIDLMHNPIIAIIALSLFGPAEKFIRKLFGFEEASTLSQIGNIAGGAMIMNMLKNTPRGGKGGDNSGGIIPNRIRNQENKGKDENNRNNSGGAALSSSSNSSKNSNSGNSKNGKKGISSNSKNSNVTNSKNSNSGNSGNSATAGSRRNGVKALGKYYGIRGVNKVASMGGKLTRTGVKAAGAFGGAIVGLSAGVADGEIGLPVKQVGIGAMAGSGIANKINPKKGSAIRLGNAINRSKEVYQKGKLEDEEREQQEQQEQQERLKKEKEFYESKEWQDIEKDKLIEGDKKERAQELLNAGMYDGELIHELLKNNISLDDYQVFSSYGITDMKKVSSIRERNPKKSADSLAKNMIVAENGKPFMNSQKEFERFAQSCGLNKEDIEDLWKNRDSYLI